MLNHTIDQIASLKFHGLKAALLEQLEQPGAYTEMSFEERISHLIDREVLDRRNRRTQRMLGISKLKHKSVFPEDVDYQAARNLERAVLQSLFQNRWLLEHHNVVLTGPTGTGKTFLACVLGNQAILSGHSVYYTRISPLITDVALARAEGTYPKWMKKMARFDLLILDDFGLSSLTTHHGQDHSQRLPHKSERRIHEKTEKTSVSLGHFFLN